MAFSPPTFNLQCDIYTGPWIAKVLRIPFLPCNLAWGRRSPYNFAPGRDDVELGGCSTLLVPLGSDVRDASTATGYDVIEVPRLSGRWYYASVVDDVGKGFDNEYRIVVMGKACAATSPIVFPGVFWPTPIP